MKSLLAALALALASPRRVYAIAVPAVRAPGLESYLATVRAPELQRDFFSLLLPGYQNLAEFAPFGHSVPENLRSAQDEAAREFLAHNVYLFESLRELGVKPLSMDPRAAASDPEFDRELYAMEIEGFARGLREQYAKAEELARRRALTRLEMALYAGRAALRDREHSTAAKLEDRAMELELILHFHGHLMEKYTREEAREAILALNTALQGSAGPRRSPREVLAPMWDIIAQLGLTPVGEAPRGYESPPVLYDGPPYPPRYKSADSSWSAPLRAAVDEMYWAQQQGRTPPEPESIEPPPRRLVPEGLIYGFLVLAATLGVWMLARLAFPLRP